LTFLFDDQSRRPVVTDRTLREAGATITTHDHIIEVAASPGREAGLNGVFDQGTGRRS